ncbi:MAG TPA: LEPR-XLL domain-containing protein, partial [Cellvibrio sp.]|nr:LEPR-XLL domain-containing protein [Cellvibrio sp.]
MPTSPRHRRPLIEALEPRLLFSATADIAVFDDGHSDGQYLAQAAEQLDLLSVYQPDDALASVASASVEPVDDSDDT